MRALVPAAGLSGVIAVPLLNAAAAIPGADALLLFLLPLLLLIAVLVAGRYPGEERLRAVARWWADRRPVARRASVPAHVPMSRRAPRAHVPRGGLVVAHHLAVRPPPVASAFHA